MPRDEGDDLLAGLCQLWLEKVGHARDHKRDGFQAAADEAMLFYKPPRGKGYAHVYKAAPKSPDFPEPSMEMTLNKVAELVEIFGPLLYSKNPVRQVNPRPPAELPPSAIPDPYLHQALLQREMLRVDMDALKGDLISSYLNWTPNELGLKDESEAAIDEALIKGRGCLWTELVESPGTGYRAIGSFFDSVDFLFIDPDAESLKEAWWIARECCHPVWEVERKYGLRPGSLKGNRESYNMQAEVHRGKAEYDRKSGRTNDLLVYYQVYSKMGCGGRLKGSDKDLQSGRYLNPGDLAGFAATLDPIAGDYVYLVVADSIPYPLNLPPETQRLPILGDGSELDGLPVLKQKLQWPVPYWADRAWPVSVLDFHKVPRSAWPMNHIEPAMGELRFLCWAYSFTAGKIKNTLRDVICILKEMSEKFKIEVLEGADLGLVELEPSSQVRNINEIVQVLQFPQMNGDIWRIIEAVEANFDKRVGLNEVFYGMQQSVDRSAAASQLKSSTMNIRPDDMAERVEAWMTEVARKEAVAARLLLAPADVLPVLGPTMAALWGVHVSTSDLSVFRELEYRIEAGSTKKPNRDRDVANADAAMQVLLPVFERYGMQTMNLTPMNNLLAFYAKTRDLPPGQFVLPPLPPPMPMAPPAGGPSGGEGPPPDGGGPPP